MSPRDRFVGLYAVVAAVAAVVVAPLFAVSYFATDEGSQYLAEPTVAAWAEPIRDVMGALVTYAPADRVYSTYALIFALLFGGVVACALVTRRRRSPRNGSERWAWRIALIGYGLFCAGLLVVSLMLLVVTPDAGAVNAVFLIAVFPGILLSVIGSTVLGIALVRAGYRPRLAAWLLTLAFPLWVIGSFVIGHNSIGMVPLFLAWGAQGWALRRGRAPLRAEPTPT